MNLLQLLALLSALPTVARVRREAEAPRPRPEPPQPTGDPITDAVNRAYYEILERLPTEDELRQWRLSIGNPGAQAAIARQYGLRLPKGGMVPGDVLYDYVRGLVKGSAGPELESRRAEEVRRAEEWEAASRLQGAVFKGVLDILFNVPEEKKPLKTLAREEFEFRKKQYEDALRLQPFSQYFNVLSTIGLQTQPYLSAFSALLSQLGPSWRPSFWDLFTSDSPFAQFLGTVLGRKKSSGTGTGTG
jgi:hypothetical protein